MKIFQPFYWKNTQRQGFLFVPFFLSLFFLCFWEETQRPGGGLFTSIFIFILFSFSCSFHFPLFLSSHHTSGSCRNSEENLASKMGEFFFLFFFPFCEVRLFLMFVSPSLYFSIFFFFFEPFIRRLPSQRELFVVFVMK